MFWPALVCPSGSPFGLPFPSCVSICVELPFGRLVTALLWIERVMGVVHKKKTSEIAKMICTEGGLGNGLIDYSLT